MIACTLESPALVYTTRHADHPQRSPVGDATQPHQTPPLIPVSQCDTCIVRCACLAGEVQAAQRDHLGRVVHTWRRVAKGAALFRAGDPLHVLYAIRSGSFKTVVSHPHGTSRVTGFQLAGDTLGLDGIAAAHYTCDAIALEDSTVCAMPFARLEALCHDIGTLQHRLHQLLAEEIVHESGRMLLTGLTIEARVAAFLLNLSERMQVRGYSATRLTLRMTRQELGSYLGAQLETISRVLSRFKRQGWITVSGMDIELIDKAALAAL